MATEAVPWLISEEERRREEERNEEGEKEEKNDVEIVDEEEEEEEEERQEEEEEEVGDEEEGEQERRERGEEENSDFEILVEEEVEDEKSQSNEFQLKVEKDEKSEEEERDEEKGMEAVVAMVNEMIVVPNEELEINETSDIPDCIRDLIDSFKRRVNLNSKHFIAQHKEKTDSLEDRLTQLQIKKHVPLSEYDVITVERETVKTKLQEYNDQLKEFIESSSSLLARVQIIMSKMKSDDQCLEIEIVQAAFDRECTHFQSALPIYARRTDIVNTIKANQVTILVGETGSGKSTQVAQYLFDAGFASSGIIACTQPRKVAAITLAKRVSEEMCFTVGDELGYKVGMNTKCTTITKVLYMTDHMLLNECIQDRTLSKYSCLMIDEAHERSINTDVLLAFIKQCLPSCPNLKVVVMSATIEPKLFVDYFKEGNISVGTIMVSGRAYPVGVVYKPPNESTDIVDPSNKYVMKAVEVAKRINMTEPAGDILVFLTCAPEIEKACEAMRDVSSTTEVLPLHGKLPPEEQQKVFEESREKRKVIFATNVAETSVTIPGVKYVIDTGLAKEMQFDPRKNMNSLEVRMISKSSAKQRKGRAGRTSPGKCYRLYSKEQYEQGMLERSTPEILRIQLAQVVMKLYEFGVPDVLTFNFVEHPNPIALESAVTTLQFLGAIKDGSLTNLGKKIAILPLDPQLSKVLLDGIEAGIGTEALCAVALSSLSSQVFFRGSTDEMKLASDKKKLEFVHPMGDQMTNLIIYQNWLAQPKDRRTMWCVDNYINAKSMRIVHEMVKEVSLILKKKLHKIVKLELESLHLAECFFPKIFFDSFLTNLAVYLDHPRAGYMFSEVSGPFLLFPGSSLKQLNCSPKYIIYERTLKTSQKFLTQVMRVDPRWVEEAISSGRLAQDPATKFRAFMVTPLHITSVGPHTYFNTIIERKKREDLVKALHSACSDPVIPPIVDLSEAPKQWGVVCVLSPQMHHSTVKCVVTQCTSRIQETLKSETRARGITKDSDNVKLVIGSGCVTEQVMMPYQFRTVVAEGPHNGEWSAEVQKMLKSHGRIIKIDSKQLNDVFRVFVTFESPSTAIKAVFKTRYPEVAIFPSRSDLFTLKIEWERRERANFAFLEFDSPQKTESALYSIQSNIINLGITARRDRDGRNQIFLTSRGTRLQCINPTYLERDIRNALENDVHFRLRMGHKKCNTSDEECHEYEQILIHIISKYAMPGEFTLRFKKPFPTANFFQATVKFVDPEVGHNALLSGLRTENIGGKHLTITPNLDSTIVVKKEIFILVQNDLEDCRKRLLDDHSSGLKIQIWPTSKKNKDLSCISLHSDEVKTFAKAQNALHSITQPQVVVCKTTKMKQYLLSQPFCEQVNTIQTSTSTYIWPDRRNMLVKIYGSEENKTQAEQQLYEGASALFSGGAKSVNLNLRGSEYPPGIMKHLLCRYGPDLEEMKGIDGVRLITLNFHRQNLTLLATSEGHTAVKKVYRRPWTCSTSCGK